MVHLRRLDPLANASLYQKMLKTPVKSFTLTEEQFGRIEAKRAGLGQVREGEEERERDDRGARRQRPAATQVTVEDGPRVPCAGSSPHDACPLFSGSGGQCGA